MGKAVINIYRMSRREFTDVLHKLKLHYTRGQHGPMVKTDSTHASGPGLIPGAGKEQNGCLIAPTTRQNRSMFKWVYNYKSNDPCIIVLNRQVKDPLLLVNVYTFWAC